MPTVSTAKNLNLGWNNSLNICKPSDSFRFQQQQFYDVTRGHCFPWHGPQMKNNLFLYISGVSFLLCSAARPKPVRFPVCFTNKTYCWHVLGFCLTNEFSENRSRTKSQYHLSCLLAPTHPKIQTGRELQTARHTSDGLCDAGLGTTAAGLLWPLTCSCVRLETAELTTSRLVFLLQEAQEGDRVPPFKKGLYSLYHVHFSSESSLSDQQKVKTRPTWSN